MLGSVLFHVLGSVLGLWPRMISDKPPNHPMSVREFCLS